VISSLGELSLPALETGKFIILIIVHNKFEVDGKNSDDVRAVYAMISGELSVYKLLLIIFV
jgi:hypothetical protein